MIEISRSFAAARARIASTSPHASDPNTLSDPILRKARRSKRGRWLVDIEKLLRIQKRPEDILKRGTPLCRRAARQRLERSGPFFRPRETGERNQKEPIEDGFVIQIGRIEPLDETAPRCRHCFS